MKDESSRLGLKLLSLALAVGFWFAVNHDRPGSESQRLVEASVTYNAPSNLILMDPVSRVEVRLQGPEDAVTTLNPQMVHVSVDLTKMGAGTEDVRLDPEKVSVPRGLEVVSVYPSTISLELDYRDERQLPVREVLVGEPAAGARVTGRRVTPDQVTASGPRSVLDRTRSLTTEPVHLDTHALTFEETVAVRTPDPNIKLNPARVTVRVELEVDHPDVSGLAPGPPESS